ncbi:MAG: XdhC family protein, partial [Chthoniobacterales bacterium]
MASSETIYRLLLDASQSGEACALVTVATVTGSAPREPGAKMVVFEDGHIVGTIGGGKFESLVIEEAVHAIANGGSVL